MPQIQSSQFAVTATLEHGSVVIGVVVALYYCILSLCMFFCFFFIGLFVDVAVVPIPKSKAKSTFLFIANPKLRPRIKHTRPEPPLKSGIKAHFSIKSCKNL